jgi:hypothetical protein
MNADKKYALFIGVHRRLSAAQKNLAGKAGANFGCSSRVATRMSQAFD